MSISFDQYIHGMGFRVILNDFMADYKQVKFPRSKKKRIRRKWAKNLKNYAYVPWTKMYQMGGDTLVMHPAMYERLKRELNGN